MATVCPRASPSGKSSRAAIWLKTTTGADPAWSWDVKVRPWINGTPKVSKKVSPT